jgi:UDP-N-acetylmuramate: L-alanyl-gamma-D-glutamyl-meso-diaminopimelate ligase
MLACHCIGVAPDDFYREISTFTGASNRLEKICETESCVAYKDFAHSPSKLKATVNAVRERYPEKKLVAAMELHTFSSLMADFLPQYKDCMAEADIAYVYFNPKVIEHKRLTPITADEVRKAFGTANVTVFTESEALQTQLKQIVHRTSSLCPSQGIALLMMSSGTFDGIDVKQFATQLLAGH